MIFLLQAVLTIMPLYISYVKVSAKNCKIVPNTLETVFLSQVIFYQCLKFIGLQDVAPYGYLSTSQFTPPN